jgi:hypothetical protein
MQRDEPGRAQKHWTPARLAALETDQILSRLRALGVDGRPEAFLPLAQKTTCAWDVSTAWRQALAADGRELDRHADDFLGLSACELWKRTCPERPSQEMLDDWMQAGYELSMEREARRACDRWLEVWEVIRSRLTPGMRTCEDAEVIFNGTQSIFNWVQDFAAELLNAAAEDPSYAARGAEVCEQVLAQFGDEGELFVINFRCDLGELLFKAGRAEQGERVLVGLMEDHPDHPAGYQRLAIMLGFSSRPEEPPRDRARAIALLQEALARPVEDPERWGVREWLADLTQSDPPAPENGPNRSPPSHGGTEGAGGCGPPAGG